MLENRVQTAVNISESKFSGGCMFQCNSLGAMRRSVHTDAHAQSGLLSLRLWFEFLKTSHARK